MAPARRKGKPIVTELYDLAKDPNETQDVAEQNPAVVAELEALLAREHTPNPVFRLPGIDK
jgi:arylsulfatase